MPRAGLTRDRVIEAAGRYADEYGFDALTSAGIARMFDVKPPTLYGHFANIGDIKKGVALMALSRLADLVEAAVIGRSGKEALTAYADAYRDFARQYPGLFQAARYPLEAESVAGSGGARLSRISLSMLRGYDIEDADRVHATRLIGAFVLGFSLLELAGSFDHSAPDAASTWQRGIDNLDGLLRSWSKN